MVLKLFEGEQEQLDVTYYGIVRSTLTAVDGQRLTASIYGVIITSTVLGGAVTISHNIDKTIDFTCWLAHPVTLQIWYIFGAYLCCIAVVIAQTFIVKIAKLNHFINTSVEIGKKIEKIFLKLTEISALRNASMTIHARGVEEINCLNTLIGLHS